MIVFLATIILLSAAAYGAYYFWKRRIDADLAEGAVAEYERLERADPDLLKGLDRKQFSDIYARVEMPRFPGYAVAVLIVFLLGTPVFLALLTGGDYLLTEYAFTPPDDIEGTNIFIDDAGQTRVFADIPPEATMYYLEDLGGFFYFFGLLGFWIIIVIYFMQRYHSRTPGSVRDEILRAR